MHLIEIILKGFSQVFFLEHTIFGLTIVGFLAVISPLGLIMAIIGNLTGVMVGTSLGVKKSAIDSGIFGFNEVLIGTLVAFYVKQVPLSLVLTIITSLLAAVIYYLFFKNNIPAYALPFALMGWVVLIVLKYLKF